MGTYKEFSKVVRVIDEGWNQRTAGLTEGMEGALVEFLSRTGAAVTEVSAVCIVSAMGVGSIVASLRSEALKPIPLDV